MSDNAAPILSRLLAACNGHPHAKIVWPHRLLRDAVAEIQRLTEERDAALAEASRLSQIATEPQRELSALRAELAEAKDTLKEHEEEHWCFNAEHGQVIIERDRLRAELEAVKAAEGELEVWLCPVHKSLDDSRKLEPLDNCVACIRAERNELRVRLEELERDTKRLDHTFRTDSPIAVIREGYRADGDTDHEWLMSREEIDAAISQTAQPEESK